MPKIREKRLLIIISHFLKAGKSRTFTTEIDSAILKMSGWICYEERWGTVKKTALITVQDVPVTVMHVDQSDYISLTDMAKARTDAARAADVIKNWLWARSTLEFLGTWEMMYNPDFKVVEFDHFKSEAGLHTFTLSAKEWIERTNAIGIYVQAGRYGGTYAHKDIAFEFGSAISPVFKLYLLKEYQRLKDEENDRLKLEWNAKRFLSKNNYIIHTDAVKNYVLPKHNYKKDMEWLAYADEADLLNVVLFGCTVKRNALKCSSRLHSTN